MCLYFVFCYHLVCLIIFNHIEIEQNISSIKVQVGSPPRQKSFIFFCLSHLGRINFQNHYRKIRGPTLYIGPPCAMQDSQDHLSCHKKKKNSEIKRPSTVQMKREKKKKRLFSIQLTPIPCSQSLP